MVSRLLTDAEPLLQCLFAALPSPLYLRTKFIDLLPSTFTSSNNTSYFFYSKSSVATVISCSVARSRLHSAWAVLVPLSTLCSFCTNIWASNFSAKQTQSSSFPENTNVVLTSLVDEASIDEDCLIWSLSTGKFVPSCSWKLISTSALSSRGVRVPRKTVPVLSISRLCPPDSAVLADLALCSTSLWLLSVTVDFSSNVQLDFWLLRCVTFSFFFVSLPASFSR